MEKKYFLKLVELERIELKKILSNGNETAKKHKISKILLLLDSSEGGANYKDSQVVKDVLDFASR